MELLYVWIDNIGRGIRETQMNFSDKFKVNYDKTLRKFTIRQQNEAAISYGRNILSINLLAGRNGSGKSSIISLLGLDATARSREFEFNQYEDDDDKAWFAVYHLRGDKFLVEGYNHKALAILKNCGFLKSQYSLIIKYEFDKNQYHITNFGRQEDFNGWYMFYDSANSSYWRDNGAMGYGADVLVYRYRLNKTGFSDVFKYLCEATKTRALPGGMDIRPVAPLVSIAFDNELSISHLGLREYNLCSRKIYGNDNMLQDTPMTVPILGKRWRDEDFRQSLIIKYLEGVLYRAKISDAPPKKTYVKPLNPTKDYAARKEFLLAEIEELTKNQGGNNKIDRMFCDALEKIDAKYFVNNEHNITIPIADANASSAEPFLECLDEYIEFINNPLSDFGDVENTFSHARFFRVRYERLSDGEIKLINFYAALYSGVKYLRHTTIKNKVKALILLLDEPDRAFHPEWSRLFINSLSRTLGSKMFSKYKYQVIIGTHSPIMLSDIDKKHIHCIDRHNDRAYVSTAKFGFMSNIHDIMKETFFIKFPVGEFAKNYVDCMLKDIINLETKEIFSIQDKKKLCNLTKQIQVIDEPTVRRHIEQRLANLISFAAKTQKNIADNNTSEHWSVIEKHFMAILSEEQKNDQSSV